MFNKHEAGYLKRDTSHPKGRQVESSSIADVRELIDDLELRRDLLIEALHKIQDEVGHLRADHIDFDSIEVGASTAPWLLGGA